MIQTNSNTTIMLQSNRACWLFAIRDDLDNGLVSGRISVLSSVFVCVSNCNIRKTAELIISRLLVIKIADPPHRVDRFRLADSTG